MSGDDMLPGFSPPQRGPRSWRVATADGQARVITATAFRCDAGCAVFANPEGIVAALAPGAWREVAPTDDAGSGAPNHEGIA